jgi:hypothetical protein
VLDALDRLDPQKRAEVARRLATLWDAFQAQFDGLDGFRSTPEKERADYLNTLRASADRMRPVPEIAIAVDLMARYVAVLGSTSPTSSDRELSQVAADLISQGAAMRARPRKAQ